MICRKLIALLENSILQIMSPEGMEPMPKDAGWLLTIRKSSGTSEFLYHASLEVTLKDGRIFDAVTEFERKK